MAAPNDSIIRLSSLMDRSNADHKASLNGGLGVAVGCGLADALGHLGSAFKSSFGAPFGGDALGCAFGATGLVQKKTVSPTPSAPLKYLAKKDRLHGQKESPHRKRRPRALLPTEMETKNDPTMIPTSASVSASDVTPTTEATPQPTVTVKKESPSAGNDFKTQKALLKWAKTQTNGETLHDLLKKKSQKLAKMDKSASDKLHLLLEYLPEAQRLTQTLLPGFSIKAAQPLPLSSAPVVMPVLQAASPPSAPVVGLPREDVEMAPEDPLLDDPDSSFQEQMRLRQQNMAMPKRRGVKKEKIEKKEKKEKKEKEKKAASRKRTTKKKQDEDEDDESDPSADEKRPRANKGARRKSGKPRGKSTEKKGAEKDPVIGDATIRRYHPERRLFYNGLVPDVQHIGPTTSYRVISLSDELARSKPEMVEGLTTPANISIQNLMRAVLLRSIRETDARKTHLLATNPSLRPTSLSGTLPIKAMHKPVDKLIHVHCLANIHQQPYLCLRFQNKQCTYVSLWFLGDVIRWKLVPLHHGVWATNPIRAYDQIDWSYFEDPSLVDPDLSPALLLHAVY